MATDSTQPASRYVREAISNALARLNGLRVTEPKRSFGDNA